MTFDGRRDVGRYVQHGIELTESVTTTSAMIQNWHGKRVTVMGLGRFGGGVGVTHWLVRQGARVLVTDILPPQKLAAPLEHIRDLNVDLRLGGHAEADFRGTDLVVVNPAVRDDSPFLQAAREADVPLTTEINLFVERCKARCVGITGSVGKSTIAAMTGHILQHASPDQRVWLGGNIGRSLLEDLEGMRPADIAVLELSSFQLHRTPLVAWSPHVAVITNITPNHLDWHGELTAYVASKLNIVRFQDPNRDHMVIEDVAELKQQLVARRGNLTGLWRYRLEEGDPVALSQSTPDASCTLGRRDAGRSGGDLQLRWDNVQLSVPGEHNRRNAAAALTVAHLLGVEASSAVAALASFVALPDRLQRVAVRDGVTYYNDSKSTTPEAAITAMQAIKTPLLIILGGYDKGVDLRPVAEAAARRAGFAACIGQTGPRLAEMIRAAGGQAEVCGDLAPAVAACSRRAEPGHTVLLSPACASWDQFEDYRARGRAFTRLVTAMAGVAQ